MRSAMSHPCSALPAASVRSTNRSSVPRSLSAFLIDVYVRYWLRRAPMSSGGVARPIVAAVTVALAYVAGRAARMPRVSAAAGLLSICAASLAPHAPRAAAEGIVIQGRFDTATEHVLIPVTLDGHRFWCNPDSGFSALVAVDKSKAAAAGLTAAPGIPTPDGNPPAPSDNSATTTMVVGGVTFANQSIILRRFPEEAPDMDCVMGVALLRRFVVEFDHITPKLVLHNREAYQPQE